MNDLNEGIDSIFQTDVNLGLVLRLPLGKADTIKKILLENDCRIVYQLISTEHLFICKDKPNGR